MPLPTSTIGNVGNPLDSNNKGADVYTSVPTVGSGEGPALGEHQILADGTFIQFLKAVATTAANLAVMISAWQSVFQVTPTTATGQGVLGVNDRSLSSLSNGYCTWFTLRGLAFPKVKANVAAQAPVGSSATSGTLDTASAANTGDRVMINTVVVGGADAVSPVYIF